MIEAVLRSEDLPIADRFEWWRELTARSLLPTVVTSDHAHDFRATIRQLEVGAMQMSIVSYPSLRVRRLPALVRCSDPELYQLTVTLRGTQGISQCGRDALKGVGDLLLYDSSHPYDAWVFADEDGGVAQSIIVSLPRTALPLPAAKVDHLLATSLPGDTGIGALLSQFLTSMAAEPISLRPQDAARLGVVTMDLVTVFLAHHLDAAAAVAPESRQQALMVGVRSFIERNLGDASLKPAEIAAAHHISVRYLHLLFQRQGSTVSAWIRRRRLEQCRRDLAEPLLSQQPIHAVAARWGFQHPAEFSRAFRAAYGIPPRDYRQQARHPK